MSEDICRQDLWQKFHCYNLAIGNIDKCKHIIDVN